MIDNGKWFEHRVQRLFFYEGFFTRTSIDLKPYFYPDRVDITDLDVLGLSFSIPTKVISIIADCKFGNAKAPERVLWLRGLCEYLQADHGIIAKRKLTTRVKEFARSIGLQALDEARIVDRERELGIKSYEWYGSHNPEKSEWIQQIIRKEFSRDDKLKRFYNYIVSEFWYDDNYIRLKKICNGLKIISEYWVEKVVTPRVQVYRWMLAESLILLTICLLYIMRDIHGLLEEDVETLIRIKMASGIAKYEELERIGRYVTDYIQTIMVETQGVSGILKAPSFMPEAPEYTPGIIELVMRLRAHPYVSSQLPRYQDLLLHEFGFKSLPVDQSLMNRFGFTDQVTLFKLTSNIIRFIQKYFGFTFEQIEKILPITNSEKMSTYASPDKRKSIDIMNETAFSSTDLQSKLNNVERMSNQPAIELDNGLGESVKEIPKVPNEDQKSENEQ